MGTLAPVWRVIIVTQDSARTVELTGRESLALPEGAGAIAAEGDQLELRAEKPGTVLLNDVQIVGASELRSGDQLRVNATTVLVQRATPPVPGGVRPAWSAEHFEARVRVELERLLRSRGGLGGTLHLGIAREVEGISWPDSVEVCERGAGVTFVLAFDADVAEALWSTVNASGGQIAFASAPKDGRELDALWSAALSALGAGESPERPVDEPIAVDPAMVRLRSLVERFGNSDGAAAFVGEPGSGRARWALHLHARSGRRGDAITRIDCAALDAPGDDASEIVERADALLGEARSDASSSRPARHGARSTGAHGTNDLDPSGPSSVSPLLPSDGATVLLESLDALEEEAQEALLSRLRGRSPYLATVGAPLSDRIREKYFRAELAVPPLRDRPSEILAYALQAVQRARGWLGRRGLALNADARAALQAYDWPGNVRELRNAVLLGALVSESDELRAENLPPPVVRAWRQSRERRGSQDLRASMKAVEKDVLLQALARTQWNVTQTAKELGLPRRTVVYRMSRLGLRRPNR